MTLTLSQIANDPNILTFHSTLPSGQKVVFRPLVPSDVSDLAIFLSNLSPTTRQFYNLASYDDATAKEICDAINRYDKLRFVVHSESTNHFIALFEFSFDMPDNDLERFNSAYGIKLTSLTDCRFGPCIADDYQNKGVGSTLFPHLIEVARQFDRRSIILWGGVRAENSRAIKYYEKNGFKQLGHFTDMTGFDSIDMMLTLG